MINTKGRNTIEAFKFNGYDRELNIKDYETDIYIIWEDLDRKQITVARKDNNPVESWYDLWNIKNSIWGENTTAIEIYPSKDDLIDGQNQRHLFKIDNNIKINFCNVRNLEI